MSSKRAVVRHAQILAGIYGFEAGSTGHYLGDGKFILISLHT